MSLFEREMQTIEEMLWAAKGEFVPGRDLAAAIGIEMPALSNKMRQLRQHKPGLMLQAKNGSGYRIVPRHEGASAESCLARVRTSHTLPPGTPALSRYAANLVLIDLLPAKAAELVKMTCLDTGESAESCVSRLITYGAEVHADLVASGENPLQLAQVAA